MRLSRYAFVLSLALLLAAPAHGDTARVTLLHTTDLHGALTAYDYLADRPAPRGLVKLATMVRAVRAEGQPVLLLDAGDAIQGGGIETIYENGDRSRPEPMMTAMTRMGYDAMAVGNHEFNYGLEVIAKARAAAGFPWLAANIVRASDGQPAFGTSIVKTLGGVRVGVIGICTPAVPAFEDSSHFAGLRFDSPVEATRRETQRLRGSEHCDVVVVLAHTGLERESADGPERTGETPDENWAFRLATQVPGVDVVIAGHTHVVVASKVLGNVLVTQAGRYGEGLGRVDLELTRASGTAAWSLSSKRAQVIAVTDSIAADSALAAFALPYHRDTNAALDQPIGTAARDIGAPRGRLEDGPLWELIQQAQLHATGADVSLAALFDPNAKLPKGRVTLRDALACYPYDNTLGVVQMTGAALKDALEQSAGYFMPYTYAADQPLVVAGMPGFNFDAAEGVTYEIDLTRQVGDRILHLAFAGAPLAPDRVLKVAVNNYRMNGGGGYAMITNAPRLMLPTRNVRDEIVNYVRAQGTLTGAFTPNWTLLPDYATTRERPLIDLLVRQGVAPKAEVQHLVPDEPARRGDLAYWLARAFDWRETKLSGAFSDVPDSLEPWLDGLLKRRILGAQAANDWIQPFAHATLYTALDWCEAAARSLHYALGSKNGDPSFRRGLLTGVSLDRDSLAHGSSPPLLTRSQVLGIVANTRFPTIRILETTDFHGFILPGAKERRTNRAIGGSAVMAAHIARLRAENPEGTVLVDGGDCFQGTMISNLQFGRPIVEQMNALGYSAMAVGNHEFDWTIDTLAARVHEMHFAALAANMVERRTRKLPRWARPDTLVSRRGVRIGVIGLAYVNTPTVTLPENVASLRFEDDSTTAARLAPVLRKRDRAQVVIGVGHIPAESDSNRKARSGDLLRLARGVKGVDAWFGGHSHNQILDEVNGIPFMIAGAHGEVIGVCDLTVDPVANRVIGRRTRLVTTYADEVTPDSAMLARVERWNHDVAPIASEVLGRNAQSLGRNRDTESTLGDLVSDAMREVAKADVAMQNSGGLRADLPAGPITKGGIYEVMPFDNTIVTAQLTGAEVRKTIEDGLRFGRVTQQSGLRYVFDLSRPPAERLVTLTLADGSTIEDAKHYKVAVNNFMASGGDNYEALAKSSTKVDTGLPIREALEAYVVAKCRNGGVLDVKADGRARRLNPDRDPENK
jgi:2',3'-cyclic-nucleotide 2'-phosphodiesterase (5'-nucleotidase family)